MKIPLPPLEEKMVAYLFELVNLAGNKKQRHHNAKLKALWSSYQGAPTKEHKRALQKAVLIEAIPQYMDEVNLHLYDYFIHDFKLDVKQQRALHNKLNQLKVTLNASTVLVQPQVIARQFSPEFFERCLVELMEESDHWRGKFKKPKLRHGLRLFAAFCISIRADQLALQWKKKLRDQGSKLFQVFSCDKISEPLITLLEQIDEKYHLKSSRFVKKLQEAIRIGDHYFESCTQEDGFDSIEKKSELLKA